LVYVTGLLHAAGHRTPYILQILYPDWLEYHKYYSVSRHAIYDNAETIKLEVSIEHIPHANVYGEELEGAVWCSQHLCKNKNKKGEK